MSQTCPLSWYQKLTLVIIFFPQNKEIKYFSFYLLNQNTNNSTQSYIIIGILKSEIFCVFVSPDSILVCDIYTQGRAQTQFLLDIWGFCHMAAIKVILSYCSTDCGTYFSYLYTSSCYEMLLCVGLRAF